MASKEQQIIEDIKSAAKKLKIKPGEVFSRSKYFSIGNYNSYHIYDGGRTWEYYCTKAGYSVSKVNSPVTDEYYFRKLKKFVDLNGRLPKSSEKKNAGINFTKSRWPMLNDFFESAAKAGFLDKKFLKEVAETLNASPTPEEIAPSSQKNNSARRTTPPIPTKTNRTNWQRINIDGFPYAPHDENGTLILFGILCSQQKIRWQILSIHKSKGIDSICFDETSEKELRVELKFLLTKSGWNHKFDDIDYLVCWESRWPGFPKPVIELKKLIEK